MKYIYLTLNWTFGVIFTLLGLAALEQSFLSALCFIIAASFLLPPVRNFFYSKTKKTISTKARFAYLFVLFIAFGFSIDQPGARAAREMAREKAEEEAAQTLQKNIAYFTSNRETLISSVKKTLSQKDYQSAISQSSKYLIANDTELMNLHSQAKRELKEAQKYQKTKNILEKLKLIPVSEFEKNRNLYRQLVELHKDNEQYKSKLSYYKKEISDKKTKKFVEEARKKQIKSQFSAWDGSHYKLERVIKESMNDPDSYDHVKTAYWEQGNYLVVKTTFRGKNAFGGFVKNSVKAKVDMNGQVIEILDQY